MTDPIVIAGFARASMGRFQGAMSDATASISALPPSVLLSIARRRRRRRDWIYARHPIGASGAQIIVALVAALKSRRSTRGVAAICIGAGEATAVAIELTSDHDEPLKGF